MTVSANFKSMIIGSIPYLRRIRQERLDLRARIHAVEAEKKALVAAVATSDGQGAFLSTDAHVLQYRRAYFEVHGHVAPGDALPSARAWPQPDTPGLTYKDKLTRHINLSGKGVEIGPLNYPLLTKDESEVYFVDHVDTEGLKAKYPSLSDIAPVDLPMVDDNLETTLRPIAPIDYLVGSQVMEHVPNPIRWLNEIAASMHDGAMVSLSLPDRRLTFDFFREETKPAEMVSAFLRDETIPNVLSVYDNQSLATAVSMPWLFSDSIFPDAIVAGRGAVSPRKVQADHLAITRIAQGGTYLDAHCWVFTPPSFLLLMAQLAEDDFLPFRLHQFYPTNPASSDRASASFIVIMERVSDVTPQEKRRSFLMPLG